MGVRRLLRFLLQSLLLAGIPVGCVRHAHSIGHDAAALSGTVRLVPRAGVIPGSRIGGPYADRRVRDVEFVHYKHPGFVVVYVDGPAPVPGSGRLTIDAARAGARLTPPQLAVAVGAEVLVHNGDQRPHVVSCPTIGVIHRLAPGEDVRCSPTAEGPFPVYLLDVSATALIFAAPGPFTVAEEDGRWELHGVPPGRRRVHAWHPRFPGAEAEVDAARDAATHVDLELGVGNLHGPEAR